MIMLDFRICRCCLSTEEKDLSSGNSYGHILDLITKNELATVDLWLCHRCHHTMRRISDFRTMCLQAQTALNESCTIPSDKQMDYFKRERSKLRASNETTLSNILCMDVLTPERNNSNTQWNYTENINDNQMDKEIKLESTNVDKFDSARKELRNIEFEIETNECDDYSTDDDDTILDYPVIENSYRGKLIGRRKRSVKNEMFEEKPIVTEVDCDGDKKGEIIRATKCKEGESLIEDGKASEVSLTLSEQLQEKKNRAMEQEYISSPFKCDHCVVSFKHRHVLEKHMIKHMESSGAFVCPVCRLRFRKSDRLYEHRKIHATRLLCLACGASHSKLSRLKEHLRWHAGETLSCADCQKTFRHKSTLRYHSSVHHRKGEYHCDLCDEVFQYQVELGKHQMLHLKSSRSYACDVCDKTFCTAEALGSHGATHRAAAQQHYCVECDAHFKSAVTLNVHLTRSARHRDPSTLKFECASCPRRLPSAEQLATHVREVHERVTCNACETCGLGFSSWRRLYIHKRKVHLGYKPARKYLCQLCHKAFQSKSVLDRHALTHTGARPHACDRCHNTFTQRSALATHVKLVHLKIKRAKIGRKVVDGDCMD